MPLKTSLTFAALVLAALTLLLTIGAIIFSHNKPEDSFIERTGESTTPEELVAETVREVRAETVFPQPVTNYETWAGIEGRGPVLTYQFVADNLENLRFDTESMKSIMVPALCEDEEVRYMLRAGVEVVYAYSVVDSSQTFSVSVTENDCK